MAIAPIGPLPSIQPLPSSPPASAPGGVGTSGSSFTSSLANAVNSLQQTQAVASADEAKMAAGQGNVADTMIAASEASVQTQVSTDLINKAITSYSDIFNMSL